MPCACVQMRGTWRDLPCEILEQWCCDVLKRAQEAVMLGHFGGRRLRLLTLRKRGGMDESGDCPPVSLLMTAIRVTASPGHNGPHGSSKAPQDVADSKRSCALMSWHDACAIGGAYKRRSLAPGSPTGSATQCTRQSNRRCTRQC